MEITDRRWYSGWENYIICRVDSIGCKYWYRYDGITVWFFDITLSDSYIKPAQNPITAFHSC